jgi:hypothetical protein
MTLNVCIQVAPLFTAERLAAGIGDGRTLYARESLRFKPADETIPLLVDHDHEREVGVVREFVVWDEIDGPWFVARASVTKPPGWLKRGTPASLSFHSMGRASSESRQVYEAIVRRGIADAKPAGEWEYVERALVGEVSILSPGVQPAEPLAKVLLVERADSPVAVPDRSVAGEQVIHGDGRLLRRPAIGRVLGVH